MKRLKKIWPHKNAILSVIFFLNSCSDLDVNDAAKKPSSSVTPSAEVSPDAFKDSSSETQNQILESLSYPKDTFIFTVGSAIAPIIPVESAERNEALFSIKPSLPNGVVIDGTNGVISGTPLQSQNEGEYVVTVIDKLGVATFTIKLIVVEKTFEVLISEPSQLNYTNTNSTYIHGTAILPNIPTHEGGDIDEFAVTPDLPAGLSIDAKSGVISGTPTSRSPASSYIVTAKNAAGNTTANLSITVLEAAPLGLVFDVESFVFTQRVAIISATPSYTSETSPTFSVVPSLPAGLAIDADTGTISGTPSVITADNVYVVSAQNSGGSAAVTIHISVVAPPAIGSFSINSVPDKFVTTSPVIEWSAAVNAITYDVVISASSNCTAPEFHESVASTQALLVHPSNLSAGDHYVCVSATGLPDGSTAAGNSPQKIVIDAWPLRLADANGAATGMIDFDKDGNLVLIGTFMGVVDFSRVGTAVKTSNGLKDIFIAKYQTTGDFISVKTWGGTADDSVWRFSFGTSGDLVLTGGFSGAVNFNPGGSADTQSSIGTGDATYITKFLANGEYAWTKVYQPSGAGEIGIQSIAVGSNGVTYVLAQTASTYDLDFTVGTDSSACWIKGMAYVKIEANGNYGGSKFYCSSGVYQAEGGRILVTPQHEVIIASSMKGSVNLDPGRSDTTTNLGWDADPVLIKYDSSGNFSWWRHIDGGGWGTTSSASLDSSGNIYWSAFGWNGSIDLNPEAGVNTYTSLGGADAWLLKIGSNGNYIWGYGLGGYGDEYGSWAAQSNRMSNDFIYYGNMYNEGGHTIDLDPTSGVDTKTPSGGTDFFISNLKADGSYGRTRLLLKGTITSYSLDSSHQLWIAGTVDTATPVSLANFGYSQSLSKINDNGFFVIPVKE